MPAPLAIDQTKIVNKAQVLLGQSKRFTSLPDDGDQNAIDYMTLWPIAVRSALARHPWNFAIGRKRINPDTIVPVFGWAFRYKLPADCVRYLPWARGETEFFDGEVEDGFILTDRPAFINIRYIKLVEDISKWSALFADTLAHVMALERCEGATSKAGLRDRIETSLKSLLFDAKRADALENGNRQGRRQMVNSRWAGARYRPNGLTDR